MSKQLSIALVGIGGYGIHYVTPLLDAVNQNSFHLVATVDPSPKNCKRLADLEARRVPIYPSLDAFNKQAGADLVVLCTPLHLHASQTCAALARGSNVLCEKPLCATPDEARAMATARDRAGKHVAIGYQWSFSRAIQQLKSDILSGILGEPKRLRSLVLWPRDEAYYRRNRWAGAIKNSQGNWVLDSPVNNACAHYLHNMLYVLGPQIDRSAQPERVTAELYRAHPIENYDTAALRCCTRSGVEILFIVSHATDSSRGPIFSYEFERGSVEYSDKPGAAIVARFNDGTTKSYGTPNEQRDRKLWLTLEAIRNGGPPLCGIEAAAAHTQCVWAAQQSGQEIGAFPKSLVKVSGPDGSRRTSVDGLAEALEQCYQQWKLPSELRLGWAKPAREIVIDAVE
jgi:predicted dehydrogenase